MVVIQSLSRATPTSAGCLLPSSVWIIVAVASLHSQHRHPKRLTPSFSAGGTTDRQNLHVRRRRTQSPCAPHCSHAHTHARSVREKLPADDLFAALGFTFCRQYLRPVLKHTCAGKEPPQLSSAPAQTFARPFVSAKRVGKQK